MARTLLAFIVLLISISLGVVYSQEFNPKEIDNLPKFPMNFGLRAKDTNQIPMVFGEPYIAVKFRDTKLYNPNVKKEENVVEYYYVYSENSCRRTIWGLVTGKKILGNIGQVLYDIVVPTDDEIVGLSHEVIEFPLSLSFFAKEKGTGKSYVTETYVSLWFDVEKKMLKVIYKDY